MFQTKKNNKVFLVCLFVFGLFYYILYYRGIKGSELAAVFGGATSKKAYYDHVREWEGGSSSDSNDTQSANTTPNTDIHTNKGIAWNTYVTYCEVFNKNVDETEFLLMPDDLWSSITNSLYWDKWDMENLKCTNARYVVHAYAYGSGNMGAEIQLANWIRSTMLINDSDITKTEIINHLNTYADIHGCKALVNDLINERLRLYTTFSSYEFHGNGWENRIEALRTLLS